MKLISIGPNCLPAYHIERCDYRTQAYPFDWLLIDVNNSLTIVAKLIETEFKNFVNPMYLRHNTLMDKDIHGLYKGLTFHHHSPLNKKEDHDAFIRRSQRFMGLLKKDHEYIVFVYSWRLKNKDQMVINHEFENIKIGLNKLIKVLTKICCAKWKICFIISDFKIDNLNIKFTHKNIIVKYVLDTGHPLWGDDNSWTQTLQDITSF